MTNHGRDAGDLTVRRSADSLVVRYVFTDRQRGTRIESRYRLGAGGRILGGESRTVLADGSVGPAGDRFEIVGDSVRFTTAASGGGTTAATTAATTATTVRVAADSWVGLRQTSPWETARLAAFLLAQPTKSQIPLNTYIAGHGYLLVWADNQPAQNGLSPFGDLHVNFQLSAAGEAIALFAPDGTLQSAVVFGPQFQNVSMGLFPEGSTNGGYRFMTNFTPRAANSVTPAPTTFPVTANLLADNSMVLAWPSLAGRTYRLEFKTALEDAGWTQIGGDLSTSSAVFALTNSTGVATQRFFRVLLVR